MLFDPITIREVTLRNRIVLSPMCQYSSEDGFANDWHLVHYGSRASGGAGLVMTEAAAVEPRGRISAQDLGIWKDDHIPELQRITRFIAARGAVAGIQLAHAGRKASTSLPAQGGGPVTPAQGGWQGLAPSAIPFDQGYEVPEEIGIDGIHHVRDLFVAAATRAVQAGFRVIEVHAAHGYFFHQFLSPVTNKRKDTYGGIFENRARALIETVQMVRRALPEGVALFVRLSATDWLEPEGWDLEQSVRLCRALKNLGVDLIDCSSGAIVPSAKIPAGPGFQVPFAERIRRETGSLTGAVGLITSAEQAETILRTGQADLVFLGRELLRDPYWPLAVAAGVRGQVSWPEQYARAQK